MNRRRNRDDGDNGAAILDGDLVGDEREEKKRKRKATRESILDGLNHEAKNAIILSMYDNAVEKLNSQNRLKFSKDEQDHLLQDINSMTRLEIPSWRALKERLSRIQNNGGVGRKPGSGRPSKWSPEIEAETKARLRASAGETSKQEVFEEVISVKRPKFMSRSTFYHHLSNKRKFKNRRLRMKPHLSQAQMEERVRYANYILGLDERARQQIVYVDEKLFLAFVSSMLTLPAEDVTPEKFGISKTNQPKVMSLACLMEPRGDFSGHVGQHLFTTTVKAKSKSKNRESGVMELKTVNVTAQEYLRAWEETLLPCLKELHQKEIIISSVASPLLLQDDNAKPHRGSINGVCVTTIICEMACKKFGIHMKPLDPKQPAQSPDCNPLDTFYFRVMYKNFRQARAEDRVLRALEQGRRHVNDEVGGNSEADENDVDFGEEGDFLHRVAKRYVPLRCHPQSNHEKPKCPHCLKVIKENDDATQCDFRNSWWHNECANSCLHTYQAEMRGRGVDPTTVANEECWWCPHCAHHLCRNEDVKKNLCVICEKPSARPD